MSVTTKNIEKNVIQLDFDIDASKFEEGMEKAYLKNRKNFVVPGFRKGKVPRHIAQNYYGENMLYEDALESIFPEVYESTVQEHNLKPVDMPEITEIKQIGTGKNLIFSAKVTIMPEVELGQYKGIEVEKKEAVVTDEDVENEISRIAENNARIIGVEEDRGLQEGDTATIDFEGFIDEEPFEGGKGEDVDLEIGKGRFIEGFEEQLKGVKAGEDKDVNIKFPGDYNEKTLAGKEACFKVKVKRISIKELPEIDDEFAKDVSEFDTIDEYKKDLKDKLGKEEEQKIKNEMENAVITKVVENTTIDIPEVMIKKQAEQYVQNYTYRLQYQGMSLDQFLENSGIDEDTFFNDLKKNAEHEVKISLALEKIADVENIEVTDDQVEEEIKTLSQRYGMKVEDYKKRVGEGEIESIKGDLRARNTVDFLMDNAVEKE